MKRNNTVIRLLRFFYIKIDLKESVSRIIS